jgi:V8-like Glu-specific endopeptidase
MKAAAISALVLSLAACVETDDELDDLGSIEGEITGDRALADAYHTQRAVNERNCTGTVIGPRHILTALHCNPYKQARIELYAADHPQAADDSNPFTVIDWALPPGTSYTYDPAHDVDEFDWTDSNGNMADMMVLIVDRNLSATILGAQTHPPATLAWAYPGSDKIGIRVGAGNHDGDSNPDGVLYQNYDTTYSGDDSGGWFILDDNHVDYGDSGGPYYVNKRVVGTLTSFWGLQTRYTSVPKQLNWLLGVVGYRWPGLAPFDGYLTGETTSTFYNSERACQYACDKTIGCAGYNWYKPGPLCMLLSSVTGSSSGGTLFRAARRM